MVPTRVPDDAPEEVMQLLRSNTISFAENVVAEAGNGAEGVAVTVKTWKPNFEGRLLRKVITYHE